MVAGDKWVFGSHYKLKIKLTVGMVPIQRLNITLKQVLTSFEMYSF